VFFFAFSIPRIKKMIWTLFTALKSENNFRGNKSNMCFPVIADFLFFSICLRDLLLLWFLRGNASDSTGNKSAIETVQFLHA
jgi:hypothetical protein